MSDSLRPYGLQPARPLCPWASPGKNIGVGRHYQNEVICVGPSPTGLVPLKEEEFRIWAHTGDDHVKNSRRWQPSASQGGRLQISTFWHLDVRPVASRSVRKQVVVIQATQGEVLCYGSLGKWRVCAAVLSPVWLCDPMAYSPPGSSVHGDSPGKNTGVGCHFLLQGIFLIQGLNPDFLHLLYWQVDGFFTTLAT